MCEKDYSLLRPFDQNVVTKGDMLMDISDGKLETFLLGPDAAGDIITENSRGMFYMSHQSWWKIVPLCWVEGKPVYPDSVLYCKNTGQQYLGKDIGDVSAYTWLKQKQKKTAWVNIYPNENYFIYPTKKDANNAKGPTRIACVQIEWEE